MRPPITREPSDPDNNCPSYMCLTRIYMAGDTRWSEHDEIVVRRKRHYTSPYAERNARILAMIAEGMKYGEVAMLMGVKIKIVQYTVYADRKRRMRDTEPELA